MTYDQWVRTRKQAEALAMLDRDPKGYFEAVDLLHVLEAALVRKEAA